MRTNKRFDARTEPLRLGSRLFTLIELIVVIAIGVLLLALLLPSLLRAKGVSKEAICLSNVRQLAMGNSHYQDDYQCFCALAPGGPSDVDSARWNGVRNSGGDYDRSQSLLSQYCGAGACFDCPSFSLADKSLGPARNGGGYGYSRFIGSSSGKPPSVAADYLSGFSMKKLTKTPSKIIMFADAACVIDAAGNVQTSSPSGSLAECYLIEQTNAGGSGAVNTTASMHFRHPGQMAGVAWLDGHSDMNKMEYTCPSNQGYANYNLGFFGSKTGNALFRPIP